MSNGKDIINSWINSWINKKDIVWKWVNTFLSALKTLEGHIKIKVDLSIYATKDGIKNIAHVDTSNFAIKTNLANLKTEVGTFDTDKLKTVPVDLSKLSNVVKNEVIKKTEYDKLVNKVNNIDTSGFILKTKYDADK